MESRTCPKTSKAPNSAFKNTTVTEEPRSSPTSRPSSPSASNHGVYLDNRIRTKTVEELMTEADAEITEEEDLSKIEEEMERYFASNVACLEQSCNRHFVNKSDMLEHYRRHHIKMSDNEDEENGKTDK